MIFKDILTQIPLFSGLSASELNTLEKIILSKRYRKDEYIFLIIEIKGKKIRILDREALLRISAGQKI
ncbi:MAG: hypothetical protein ACETWK_12625 [Candidatus Aminicenantaceae bacterium]